MHFSQLSSMWNRLEPRTVVDLRLKVQFYRHHLRNLDTAGSVVRSFTPCRSEYSLLRTANKYSRAQKQSIDQENLSLHHRIKLARPKVFTQAYLPSHQIGKLNFILEKRRQRLRLERQIQAENTQIYSRIIKSNSQYKQNQLEKQWKIRKQYMNNLRKTHSKRPLDFMVLARSQVRKNSPKLS